MLVQVHRTGLDPKSFELYVGPEGSFHLRVQEDAFVPSVRPVAWPRGFSRRREADRGSGNAAFRDRLPNLTARWRSTSCPG